MPRRGPARQFAPLSEIGSSGLTRFLGTVSDDFRTELQGRRGLDSFDEISKSPIGGALLRAIGMIYRRVEWRVDAASDDPRDVEAAEFVESCTHDLNVPWASFVSQAREMLATGHRLFEIVYKKRSGLGGKPPSRFDDGRIGWRKFADRPPGTLGMGAGEWDFDEAGGLRGVWQVTPPDYRKVYLPIEKVLLFRTTDVGGNPEGESIFSPGWRAYYFVRELETVEGIVEERMGGVLVITLPDDPTQYDLDPDNADSLYSQAKDAVVNFRVHEQMGLVVPSGCTAELWSPGQGQRGIRETIQAHKRDFFMTSLCQFMMLGAERVGSWALSKDQSDFFLLALEGWMDSVEAVLNEVAIPRLLVLNTFEGLSDYPRFGHQRLGQRDVEVYFRALRDAVESGVVMPGPDDEVEARSMLGLPEREQVVEPGKPRPEDTTGDRATVLGVPERFAVQPPERPDERRLQEAVRRALDERRAELAELLGRKQELPGDPFWEEEQAALRRALLPQIEAMALEGAEKGIAALGPSIALDWTLVNQGAVDWAVSYTFDLVKGITDTSRDVLRSQIAAWIAGDEPLPRLIERLEPMYGLVRAEMIGVTETTRAFATGNVLAWKQSNVVRGRQFVTSNDDRVCPICAPLGGLKVEDGTSQPATSEEQMRRGQRVTLDAPFVHPDTGIEYDNPPVHVRCRCFLAPLVEMP